MSEHWRDRPFAPPPGTYLCDVDAVPADNGLEVKFGEGDRTMRVVLFNVGGRLKAYLNECPHFHIPYNFREDTFCVYDIDGQRDLMCAHHTALFHLEDGHCYDGPCVGARLIPVDIEITGAAVRAA
jgi:nitrite reductase/ring-hydroxylating ferredoxin subunit